MEKKSVKTTRWLIVADLLDNISYCGDFRAVSANFYRFGQGVLRGCDEMMSVIVHRVPDCVSGWAIAVITSKINLQNITELAINQASKQAINQSFNQSINRTNNQSINQAINQSINQSIDKWIMKLINQSSSQSTSKAHHFPTK